MLLKNLLRRGLMSVEVGNLELLEQLMKSSTIDLVRRFNAKKLTIGNVEVYCLDVHHIPWITTIKLGSDVDILNTKILVDISFKDGDFKKVPIGVELTIGYLLQVRENLYNIVGITLVNRKPMFQLRKFKVELLGRINKIGVIKPRKPVKIKKIEIEEKNYLPAVNFGLILLSTSQGVMSHIEAKERHIGGRLLVYVY